jgi:hypothetical protein
MIQQPLALDTIVSRVFCVLPQRNPELRRNAAPYLLRKLICKLYGAGHGNLWHAQIRASQAPLAAELAVSRQWLNVLSRRLVATGWIRYHTVRRPDGHFEIGSFRIGPQLKRVLCALVGYRRSRHRVNATRQPLPTKAEKEKCLLFLKELHATLAVRLGRRQAQRGSSSNWAH